MEGDMVEMGSDQAKVDVAVPRVGDMVQVVSAHPYHYPNGKSDPDQGVAAVVTRVWSPTAPVDTGYVNVTIFPDCGQPLNLSSVPHESNPTQGMACYWRWPQ